MSRLISAIRKFIADEAGATVVEYGVLVALVIAACIAIIFTLGNRIQSGFQSFSDQLATLGFSGS